MKFPDNFPDWAHTALDWLTQQEVWVIGSIAFAALIVLALLSAIARAIFVSIFFRHRTSERTSKNIDRRLAQGKRESVGTDSIEMQSSPDKIRLVGDEEVVPVENIDINSREEAEELVEKLGGRLGKNKHGQIAMIFLNGTSTFDAHLVAIPYFNHVESLHLRRTKITDKGIEHFESLEHLKFLYITDTKISEKGVELLKEKFPRIKIET